MLKILHTADWHLGKRLEQHERTEEHQHFLDWLIEKITTECIDVLIVAGDIFDTGNPTNIALKQYYNFLWRIKGTCCREVIIIGGNHDSVTTLNAPRDLLKFLNVHVVGGVPEDFNEQVIPIKDSNGDLQLVVCAVPFLRDKDVRLSVTGETAADIATRLRQGICDHYTKFTELVIPYKTQGIPVLATGHLYAAGATNSDSEKDIHIGNLGKIGGDQFPEEFDYIALGHLHRPQVVNKMNHIRYSGSPIPLSFSENEDRKLVLILQFDEGNLYKLEEFFIPSWRKLIRIKGNMEVVKNKIELLQDPLLHFPTWVEVQLETDAHVNDFEEQLKKLFANKPFVEHFFPRQIRLRSAKNLDEQAIESMALNDLDPRSVFQKKCASEATEETYDDLLQTFDEALELMYQQ